MENRFMLTINILDGSMKCDEEMSTHTFLIKNEKQLSLIIGLIKDSDIHEIVTINNIGQIYNGEDLLSELIEGQKNKDLDFGCSLN